MCQLTYVKISTNHLWLNGVIVDNFVHQSINL